MAATTTPKETEPPIFVAASQGEIDAVESALTVDAACASAVNEAGRSALSLAAARGHLKVVKRLIEANATDSTVAGWSSVHHAAFGGHSEVLSSLVAKFGAAAIAPAPGDGMPALLLAALKGRVACLTVLLDTAPDAINTTVDAHGRTALMCAASSGSAEAVELLVQRGADINATSNDGKTALMWAVASSKPATVVALARLGANPHVAAPCPEVVVPGQDRDKGETVEDLANARHAKDPTLRHIAKFITQWREAGYPTGDATPEMPLVPWVSHAIETKAKEEAAAAAAAEAAAHAADEPMIQEVATPGAAADENDIFGSEDAAPVPVGGGAVPVEDKEDETDEASLKQEAEDAQKAVAANADLDELD